MIHAYVKSAHKIVWQPYVPTITPQHTYLCRVLSITRRDDDHRYDVVYQSPDGVTRTRTLSATNYVYYPDVEKEVAYDSPRGDSTDLNRTHPPDSDCITRPAATVAARAQDRWVAPSTPQNRTDTRRATNSGNG